MEPLRDLIITPEILRLIAEIDEFKGRWQALGDLAPARLSALRRVATIESVASATRIEGVKLSDDEVERLLSGIETRSFRTRDEQEVAGHPPLPRPSRWPRWCRGRPPPWTATSTIRCS